MTGIKIQSFFEFIYDRQEVWYKRHILAQSAPWSEDEILQNFKFCNVYRELDGGTLAILGYLRDKNICAEQKLFNIIAYRFFNRRDTIEKLFGGLLKPDDFDFKKYEKRFDDLKKRESIFSNAYLVSSHPYRADYRPKDKHVQILLMLDNLRDKLPQMLEKLKSFDGKEGLKIIEEYVAMAGPFLSGQILLDATYAGNIVSYSANDFLIVGPGALWGLKIIFEKELKQAEAEAKCRFLYDIQKQEFAKLKERTGKDWEVVRWKNAAYCGGDVLALHDIQNSLCEFRKYWRLKHGEKAKRRYFQIGR